MEPNSDCNTVPITLEEIAIVYEQQKYATKHTFGSEELEKYGVVCSRLGSLVDFAKDSPTL